MVDQAAPRSYAALLGGSKINDDKPSGSAKAPTAATNGHAPSPTTTISTTATIKNSPPVAAETLQANGNGNTAVSATEKAVTPTKLTPTPAPAPTVNVWDQRREKNSVVPKAASAGDEKAKAASASNTKSLVNEGRDVSHRKHDQSRHSRSNAGRSTATHVPSLELSDPSAWPAPKEVASVATSIILAAPGSGGESTDPDTGEGSANEGRKKGKERWIPYNAEIKHNPPVASSSYHSNGRGRQGTDNEPTGNHDRPTGRGGRGRNRGGRASNDKPHTRKRRPETESATSKQAVAPKEKTTGHASTSNAITTGPTTATTSARPAVPATKTPVAPTNNGKARVDSAKHPSTSGHRGRASSRRGRHRGRGNNSTQNGTRRPTRGPEPVETPTVYSTTDPYIPGYPTAAIDPNQVDTSTLKHLLLTQIEYYFSIDNLCHDMYLRSKMDEEGYVPVAVLAAFNRIKKLTSDAALVHEALTTSKLLEVKGDSVRKQGDWKTWLPPRNSNPTGFPSQTEADVKK